MSEMTKPKLSLLFPNEETRRRFEINIREAGFRDSQAYLRHIITRDMEARGMVIDMGHPRRGGYRGRKGG